METFLFVLLLILKILGIILASLVGLVLLVLILILFVPIRYSGDGSYIDKEAAFRARASYLLHIVSVHFDLKDKEDMLKIKVFGFRINKKKNKNNEKHNTLDEAQNLESKNISGNSSENDTETENLKANEDKKSSETKKLSSEETSNDPDKTVSEEPDVKSAKDHKEQKKKSDNKEKSTTGGGIYDKIKRYIEKLKKDEVKQSLSLCKKQIGIVLRSILPKKWEVKGSVGFDDPSTTGTVCMILGIISPWTYKHLKVYGDFENPEIKISGYFKGRIYGIVLLVAFLRVFFNRNVRKTIKLFKEE